MIQESLTTDHVDVADVATWQDAIRRAAHPLLAEGFIRDSYLQQVIETIGGPGGTYMDLGFGITLAHARPEAGAITTGLSLLTLRNPVNLADDVSHPVRTVIFLAAADASSHQDALRELSTILMDPEKRHRLTHAEKPADIVAVFDAA